MEVEFYTRFKQLNPEVLEALRALPQKSTYRFGSVSEMYGASYVAARYCGLPEPGPIRGRTWQHGWVSPGRMQHPVTTTMGQGKRRFLHLVARREEAEFLRRNIYRSQAVGLPFAYALGLPFEVPQRIPDSVLVLPSHSSRLKLHSDIEAVNRFAKYVLQSGADRTRTVVVLHNEDLRTTTANSVWSTYPFALLEGAGVDDSAALLRMRYLFSLFETVLTDHSGSGVPMALAAGARVAVRPEERRRVITSLGFERHEVARELPFTTQSWIMNHKPELFSDLDAAVLDRRWGLQQIGGDNVLYPHELMKALGWSRFAGARR